MNKLQELTGRREELLIKIAELWDELIEVNEHVSAIKETGNEEKKLLIGNKRW